MIVGLALVADTVKPEKIGIAMGWVSIQLNLGLTLGPLLGGIMYDKAGWYSIFALSFGILAVDILLRTLIIEKHVADRYRLHNKCDAPETQESGDKVASKSPRRKLPEVIRLLQSSRLLAALWLALIQATIISALDAVLPLHLNQLFGWTSFQAGMCS